MQPTVVIEQDRPEPLPPLNELTIIQNAMDKGVSGEQLTLFTNAIAQIENRKAARQFADALTGFQAETPQIEKRKAGGKLKNSDQVAYHYAPFEEMMEVIGPIMSRHKIVATFTDRPSETPGLIRMTCRIRVGIHQEETTIPMPIPAGNQLVNSSQLMIQALSYAKRAALTLALNIVTRDEDRDGMDLSDTIDGIEIQQLRNMIADKGGSEDLFLTFAAKLAQTPIETFEQIPVAIFPKLLDGLKRVSPKPGSPAAIRAAEAKKGGK